MIFKKKPYLTENSQKWVSFYPKYSSAFYLNKAGYFDERPELITSVTQLLTVLLIVFLLSNQMWLASMLLMPFILFGWGKLYINLPIRTGIEDCESPSWGLNYHDNKIWIYIGGAGNYDGGRKWVTITMPWDLEWVRTSTLLKDGTWYHETPGNKKGWQGDGPGSYSWLEKEKWQETHPYTDKYDQTIVNATISVSEREWRPLWFKWTKLFRFTRKSIDIEFDQEVGKRKGGYKGGTVGCSYEMKGDESALDCLRRMEQDREFT